MQITLVILDMDNGAEMGAVDFGCFMASMHLCEVFLVLGIPLVIILCIKTTTTITTEQIEHFTALVTKEGIIMAQIVPTLEKEILLSSKEKQEITIGHHHAERFLRAEAVEVAVLVTENNYGTHKF